MLLLAAMQEMKHREAGNLRLGSCCNSSKYDYVEWGLVGIPHERRGGKIKNS